jgi:hypothetical protein
VHLVPGRFLPPRHLRRQFPRHKEGGLLAVASYAKRTDPRLKKSGGGSHNPRNNAKGNKSGGNGPIGKNSDSHAVHKLAAAKLQHRMEMLELKNKYLVQAVKSKTTRPATYASAAAPPYTSTSAGSTAPQFQTQQIPFPSQLGSQQVPSQQQPAPAQPLLTDIMAALTALTRQVQHLQQQQN